MKEFKEGISLVWEILRGRKTYIAGFAGLVYALIQGDPEMFLISAGLLGLRHGLSNILAEIISQLIKK